MKPSTGGYQGLQRRHSIGSRVDDGRALAPRFGCCRLGVLKDDGPWLPLWPLPLPLPWLRRAGVLLR